MKSKLICDALNTVNPTQDQKARMRAALEAQLPEEAPSRRKEHRAVQTRSRRLPVLSGIAAVIAVVLLGVFVLTKMGGTAPSLSDTPPTLSDTPQTMTLESLLSSDGYRASMEAKAVFESSALSAQSDAVPEEYRTYGCQNEEMTGKIDEICEKYGLSKMKTALSVDTAEQMFSMMGVKSLVLNPDNLDTVTSNASFDEDGNFEFWGYLYGTGVWTQPIEYRAYRAMKTTLSTAYWEIGDPEDCQWQNYVTTSGDTVLLGSGVNKALILCDAGDSVIIIVGMNATTGEMDISGITLQAFADCFDFSLKPELNNEIPDIPERYLYVLDKYVTADKEGWTKEQCEMADISPSVVSQDTTWDYGYALLDMDGNGTLELLITTGCSILDLYTISDSDGLAVHLLSEGEQYFFLCGENVVMAWRNGDDGSITYTYLRIDGEDLVTVKVLILNAEGKWLAGDSVENAQPISETEANEIMAAYPMKTVEVYGIPDPIVDLEKTTTLAYQDILDSYTKAILEGWNDVDFPDISIMARNFTSLSEVGYERIDLDGNGVEELVISTTAGDQVILDLYTLTNGQLSHILSGWERNSYWLGEGNVIQNVGSSSAAVSYYNGYQLKGDQLESLYTITFDGEKDQKNPWFLGEYGDYSHPLTEAEAYAAMDQYGRRTLELTPLGDGSDMLIDPELGQYFDYVSGLDTTWLRFYDLRDLDGDGQEELLLFTTGGTLDRICAFQDGTVQDILSGGELSLREDNVIRQWTGGSGGETYIFYRLENQKPVPLECITYRVHNDQWYRDKDCDVMTEDITPITEDEKDTVMSRYSYLNVEIKPVRNLLSDETVYSIYRPIIDNCITAINEKWDMLMCNQAEISYRIGDSFGSPDGLRYAIRDMDGNGVPELLLVMEGDGQTVLDLYTISMRQAVHVFSSGDRDEYGLRGWNDISEQVYESGSSHRWIFYELQGSTLQSYDFVCYDENYDSESHYYRGSDEFPSPISKEKAESIILGNPNEVHWIQTKPITEFSVG